MKIKGIVIGSLSGRACLCGPVGGGHIYGVQHMTCMLCIVCAMVHSVNVKATVCHGLWCVYCTYSFQFSQKQLYGGELRALILPCHCSPAHKYRIRISLHCIGLEYLTF